ncbi:hypothetical protein QFZ42_001853 [Variovorax paradoxus]|uniref:hypothetical protein n=1 Tax=Variovorax paradoxus TaxID=34073 RepID=UPI00278F4BA7|nr:hypothetical protein [Variovorax paradoxus]MDQ0570019.1 hypothetical protein [Variovorax paradoxus]
MNAGSAAPFFDATKAALAPVASVDLARPIHVLGLVPTSKAPCQVVKRNRRWFMAARRQFSREFKPEAGTLVDDLDADENVRRKWVRQAAMTRSGRGLPKAALFPAETNKSCTLYL